MLGAKRICWHANSPLNLPFKQFLLIRASFANYKPAAIDDNSGELTADKIGAKYQQIAFGYNFVGAVIQKISSVGI